MDWVLFTTLCSLLRSWTEQEPYQAVIQLEKCFLWCTCKKLVRVVADMPNFLSLLRKQKRWGAFLTIVSAWRDQDRLLVIWTPRNLKLSTISTSSPLMQTGACPPLRFLKLVTISFVLLTLRESLFSSHQFTTFSISFLYSVSSFIYLRSDPLQWCHQQT